jgi:two-component system, chemotaxis family, CheB/CheR fusion protein
MKNKRRGVARPLKKSNNHAATKKPSPQKIGDAAASADTRPVSTVGVGASAGGLEAFEQLLAALPSDSGMAFVLVQHLAPKHASILSELLRKSTRMPVVEVSEGMKVEANHVYVIPPNADMSIIGGTLHLSPFTLDRAHRMPIDSFLRSLAEDQQSRAIGVILSGTASDGTLGLQAIKALGGVTFAQDEGSAKYSAMPRSAMAAGNVDFILPPELIARELKRIAKHIYVFAVEDQTRSQEPGPPDEALNKIFLSLKTISRVDFSFYKHGTIKRRIMRRMFLRKIESLTDYLHYLRKNPNEVEALFNEVLINVTSFFRDPKAFEALRKVAFPQLLNHRGSNATIRIWVAGCSTGEEAYSLAITLLEYLREKAPNLQIQIFGTDVSDIMIQKARSAIYPENISMDVNAERLKRYFQKTDGGYQVTKTIRDMCVFAKQDITKDPPFSRLDMISCRNVMIYMGQVLQKRIVPLLHYALNPGGILFLGSSETIGGFSDLFVPIEKKHKIFLKKQLSVPRNFDFVPQFRSEEIPAEKREEPPQRVDLQKIANQILLNRYVPASVVVNEKLDIVQFIGQTGRFLDPMPGDASLNLLRMVKSGLNVELRLAFERVKKEGSLRKEGVLVKHNAQLRNVNFEIIPVKNLPQKERYYLVIFEEDMPKSIVDSKMNKNAKPVGKPTKAKTSQIQIENARLKEELEATREYLQSIIEEQKTTNEELRSANEEIQSSNEELQSINEELETAKEELQSTNEELTTVNEELQNRNDELTLLNNDLNNLLSSVNLPIVMLGNDLRVRRFTPMAEKIMNLIPADIGRPITDIKPNLRVPDLKRSISHVIESLEIQENEVEDGNGRWYSMKIRPYRTLDNKIDGVVIVLLDLARRLRPKEQ